MTSPDDLSDLVRGIHDERARESAASNGAGPTAAMTAPEPSSATAVTGRSPLARKRLLIGSAIGLAAVLGLGGGTWAAVAAFTAPNSEPSEAQPAATTQAPDTTPAPTATEPPVTEEPAPPAAPLWSIDDPASLQVVVNKQRPLNPIDWTPDDLVMPNVPNQNGQPLRAEAAAALDAMYAEASAAGVPFTLASAYRDYALQTSLFESYSASDGVEAAETYSARPGYSEHQTGLAADITECSGCGLSYEFADTAVGIWARDNAHRFGYILRYNDGQQPVVGYVYEPWHFRYVGTAISEDMHARGIANLEDYFGLPAAPGY